MTISSRRIAINLSAHDLASPPFGRRTAFRRPSGALLALASHSFAPAFISVRTSLSRRTTAPPQRDPTPWRALYPLFRMTMKLASGAGGLHLTTCPASAARQTDWLKQFSLCAIDANSALLAFPRKSTAKTGAPRQTYGP